jgi:hypothetical protein
VRAGSSVALLLALVAPAAADPATADAAFQRGRELMKAHRYAEACEAFETSQGLDPQLGTQFNLANCEVEIGKLASAWKIYRKLADSDPNPDRKALSKQLAAGMAPRLPKLVVVVPAMPPQLAVAVDGTDATGWVGVATPVDVGRHAIVVTAPGFAPRSDTVAVKEGELARLSVTLTPLGAPADAAATATPQAGESPPAASSRTLHGKIAVAGGGALVAAGLVVGAVAVSDWHDAQKATVDQDAKSHHAVVLGDVSTVLVVAGLIPAAIGVYLWQTPRSTAMVAPAAGPDRASVSIAGTF